MKLFLGSILAVATLCLLANGYQVGTGIWDVTGPAAEIGMMGYAMASQKSAGIHTRLRARAFVIADESSRVVFVSSDTCMIFNGVKDAVIQKLEEAFPGLYSHENVMLSGIHTHAGPAGFSYRPIYNLVSEGFHKKNFDTIVTGLFNSISMAHKNLVEGKMLINNGTLDEANINRSSAAYENNPPEERSKYQFNTDHIFTSLKFQNAKSEDLGSVNWFAVHGTSMTNKNHLLSGDNKGIASYFLEKIMNKNALPGFGPYVAAFGQSNEGDVSPRTKGAFCPDGTACDHVKATCGGKSQGCNGIGPGKDEFESTKIIAQKQVDKAIELLNAAKTVIEGPVQFVHAYVDMENVQVSKQFTSTGKDETTCVGALGDAFAGGTTDGPGDFDFTQGTNKTSTNPVWNFLAHFLKEPTKAQEACHSPKPILFLSGGITIPTNWTPSIIPLQIFRVGQLWIVGVPGEFTTMSGRRLRDTIMSVLVAEGVADASHYIVIAGLSNEYTHYITTYEEYQVQRYEGGSTLFGPHTLAAYQQEYSRLARALARGEKPASHDPPADISDKVFDFQTPVVEDTAPNHFGDVKSGPDGTKPFTAGDVVSVVFWGADPRNTYLNQKSFCDVEMQTADGHWQIVLQDGDIDTKFYWKRSGIAHSECTCEWTIAPGTPAGTYRVHHYGVRKHLFGQYSDYEGVSSSFKVQ